MCLNNTFFVFIFHILCLKTRFTGRDLDHKLCGVFFASGNADTTAVLIPEGEVSLGSILLESWHFQCFRIVKLLITIPANGSEHVLGFSSVLGIFSQGA